jgi:tetratricopeptide (TPR) repeat protein
MELTVDQALQQGVAAHKKGELQDAERLYRAILEAQPSHPDANHNLGVLAVAVGKPLEAIPLFKVALKANSQKELFWLSYIDTLIKVKRFDEAKRVLGEGEKFGVSLRKLDAFNQRLPGSVPNDTNKTVTGQTLKQKRKKLAERKEGKKRKVQGSSSSGKPSQNQTNHIIERHQAGRVAEAVAHNNMGIRLQELGKLNESEASYRQAIALKPDYVEAHYNLGVTLQGIGSLEEAEACYRQSIALKPDFAEAHYNLGNRLHELGRLDETEASYKQAIEVKPEFAEAHNNLGITLQELGKLDEAEACHRQALALKPDYAEAHYNLGVTLQSQGRLDEAEASYRQATTWKPDYTEAHRNLAATKKFSFKDEQFVQMQALYRDPATLKKNRCHICFALAKASEDLEDYATAFQFYVEGNALRKKQLGYDKAQDKQLFQKLKASYPLIAAHSLEPDIFAPKHAPIFIVGMPRSGTTLVEQIISSHPMVTGAGELGLVSQFGSSLAFGQSSADVKALKTFRQQYLDALKQRSKGKAIVTDKMPQNFYFLGLIAAAFPEARIVHVKRDPAAVCWANYSKYFVLDGLDYCYDLDDILHYQELYKDLMKYWHQALPDRIYDLNYEVLTEDQEDQTRKLISHAGLDWDDGCLLPQRNDRPVATASNVQVREKVYQGSSDRWKRYKPYLNDALDRLSVDHP